MTLAEFIAKWQSAALTEKAGYQEHFRDLCDLFGHPRPSDADPSGTWFTFEKGVTTTDGKQGYADVWHRGKFGSLGEDC